MEDQVTTILHRRDIDGGDTRWPISVQVEKRTTELNGKPTTYINLLIAVGQKKLFIPRRPAKDIADALKELAELANKEYTALLEADNTPRHR